MRQEQQTPLVMEIEGINSLTTDQIEQIKKYMENDVMLCVQFKDANGEVFIPVAYTPEIIGDDESVTPATITVVNGGSLVSANVVLAAPVIKGETPFEAKTEVTIEAEEGATIFYTDDGSTPETESTEYTEAIELTATTTIKAIAVKDTYQSPVATKTFTKS